MRERKISFSQPLDRFPPSKENYKVFISVVVVVSFQMVTKIVLISISSFLACLRLVLFGT